MNSQELMIYLHEKQVKEIFKAARKVPADKLEWKPTPTNRTVLDILQEVATSVQTFLPGIKARKVEWDPEASQKWFSERAKIKDIDELERLANEGIQLSAEIIRATPEDELSVKVEMPFPGEYKVVDLLIYQYWNISYHEGQINYVLSMLETEA